VDAVAGDPWSSAARAVATLVLACRTGTAESGELIAMIAPELHSPFLGNRPS
jgi:hypothetical protein